MTALHGKSPEQVFRKFQEHLNGLIHKTVTEAPLSQISVANGVFLGFRQKDRAVCVPVGRKYHLYLGQTLTAVKDINHYRLRTLAYAYRIAEGPTFDDPCIFRWEYNARDYKESLAPRHHLHVPASLQCFGNRVLDANDLHIPSGWVTVEEIIRFVIHELAVKPKNENWDRLICESEQKFREWTSRDV